jgi:CRP/FNR family cyclic AMP-dependent transcriptional regulator
MHRKTFAPGEIIFQQGDKTEEAYWILSGKVEISIETPSGRDVLTTLYEGEIFGEMGMIDDKPRTATARVIAPTEVEVIDVADFQEQILRREDRLMRYLSSVFDRLRTADAQLHAHLGKRWAEARLASGPPADRIHEEIPTLTMG